MINRKWVPQIRLGCIKLELASHGPGPRTRPAAPGAGTRDPGPGPGGSDCRNLSDPPGRPPAIRPPAIRVSLSVTCVGNTGRSSESRGAGWRHGDPRRPPPLLLALRVPHSLAGSPAPGWPRPAIRVAREALATAPGPAQPARGASGSLRIPAPVSSRPWRPPLRCPSRSPSRFRSRRRPCGRRGAAGRRQEDSIMVKCIQHWSKVRRS
jgi:hypothetical protein